MKTGKYTQNHNHPQKTLERLDILDLLILASIEYSKQPPTAYEIMNSIQSKLIIINQKITSGNFYYRIKKMIDSNLIKQNIKNTLISDQGPPTLQIIQEIDYNQLLQNKVNSPLFWDANFIYNCLIISKIIKNNNILSPIKTKTQKEMIKLNQNNIVDNKTKRQNISDNILSSRNYQKNYLEFVYKLVTEN